MLSSWLSRAAALAMAKAASTGPIHSISALKLFEVRRKLKNEQTFLRSIRNGNGEAMLHNASGTQLDLLGTLMFCVSKGKVPVKKKTLQKMYSADLFFTLENYLKSPNQFAALKIAKRRKILLRFLPFLPTILKPVLQ